MSTAEAIAVQLEIERSLRNHEDALALRLIERLKRHNLEKTSRSAVFATVAETR